MTSNREAGIGYGKIHCWRCS